MGHHHQESSENIKVAFLLNLSFTILEFLGGYFTNSAAIFADAVHDLGDCLALAQAWYFERLSLREGDIRYTYGYKRFSIFGALISSVVLLVSSTFILIESIPRLISPETTYAPGIVVFAVVGVIVNGAAMFRLRHLKGLNARVVALHFLEDILGWIAVLIMGTILLFKEIYILDPILAIIITLYILINVFKNIKGLFAVFMQAVPKGLDLKEIEKAIKGMGKVKDIHHLHLWSLDGEHHVLTAHIVVDCDITKEDYFSIKNKVKEVIAKFPIFHSTIEVELEGESCRMK